MIRKLLLKWLTPKTEEQKSVYRINRFLKRSGLSIADLKTLLALIMQNGTTN